MSLESELKEDSKSNKNNKIKTKETTRNTTTRSVSKDTAGTKNDKAVASKSSSSKKNSVKASNGKILSQGVGRRKSSVARVYLKEGEGNFIVNNIDYKVFFKNEFIYYKMIEPLKILDCLKNYDIKINVNGGGLNSQVEAVRLGISICLSKVKIENRSILKDIGFLTTDSRIVERKKPGHKKARKSFQFSKR
jgi:small subunit ribosomal protein S9